MRLISIIGFCFAFLPAFAAPPTDSLLNRLNSEIEHREKYVNAKLGRIAHLKSEAQKLAEVDRYDIYLKVYDEYKSFIYDSAFRYALKLQKISAALNDPVKRGSTRINLGFVLVSSGLFNEALDTLRTLRALSLPPPVRAQYYYLMARTCYDLSDFNRDDFYSPKYAARGHAYIDSSIALLPSHNAQYFLMTGIKEVRQYNVKGAQTAFETMIGDFKLSDADFAVAASTLSFIYLYSNQPDKSKEMLIRAAIADIRASTKETLATLNLADMLYKEGDVDGAYRYVKIAMEDANFYGARHRKVQVAAVFPIIEGQQLILVESRRKILLLYSSVITVLVLITIAFAFIIYKQFKRLGAAKKVITEANDILTETNHQLTDANKIKEEYIWYYFSTTADYINKLDGLKRSMDLKLMTKKIEDLRFTVDSINIKKERDDLYHNFDMVFLKLFPEFVTIFNSFFKVEDRIVLKEDQLLNTELRIFALIRMGIHDNEKIAKILNYSVTTIYTYKTRIRSKSLLANDVFDKQIMAIRAI
jgi:Domain of unknown function (DUF6377)